MSSDPRPEAAVRRGRLAGLTLRSRLLAVMIALLVVSFAAVGVVTTVALRGFLVGQLDSRLAAADTRSAQAYEGRPPGDETDGGRPTFPPGQPAGTVAARIAGGAVSAQILDYSGSLEDLSASQVATVARVPADGRPHTRTIGGLGDYRLQATRMADGDVLVTGLPLAEVQNTVLRLIAVEVSVAAAALLLAVVVGTIVVRRTLRPLDRVAATATKVSELTLHQGEVALPVRVAEVDTDERTEVGKVGAALNRMLGHVGAALHARQASETRVRQFVADASHELRTPLAAIRGYAELTRRMRDGTVPPDVVHAMRRVESEAARMTTLVDDLLLLARLDEGRPLAAEQVDLSRLVVDAVSDARAAGPDHRWQLDVPAEPVLVTGDGARLHQVLANLLANARTHTPPGSSVVVGLGRRGASAGVTVADDGPGIPEALRPDIFERFARADTSRSRAAGSTGLGLAIVAAVVEAHRGHVDVASRPGRTVFTVTLPALAPEPPPGADRSVAAAVGPARPARSVRPQGTDD